jgi:hypothetical protein
METYQGIVVPAPAALTPAHGNGYGIVPGLPESELADPRELERVASEEPLQLLQVATRAHSQDANSRWRGGEVTEQLLEELDHAVIMLSIVNERLASNVKYSVLEYLLKGWISLDHIVDEDMHAIAKWYLRVCGLRRRIQALKCAGYGRRQMSPEVVWQRVR